MKIPATPEPPLTQSPEHRDGDTKPAISVPAIRRILVPTDLSEHSMPALKYALSLAERFHAKIFLLNVAPMPRCCSMDAPPEADELMSLARVELDKIARTIPPEVEWEEIIRFGTGEMVPQIVQEALNISADLIVIATHGYCGLKRMLRGSLAEAVVRHAPCPVLTVHPAGEN